VATWMIHFRVADALLRRLEEEIPDREAFVFGNVAPDCGIPDESGMNYTPPRAVSHFGKAGERDYDRFFSAYYFHAKERDEQSFFLGYYSHLLTDDEWVNRILYPKYERFGGEFADFASFTAVMRNEWTELDRRYIRDHPSLFSYALFGRISPEKNHLLPHFPEDAFAVQLERIRSFYRILPTGGELRYADEQSLDIFVRECADVLEQKLRKALAGEVSICG